MQKQMKLLSFLFIKKTFICCTLLAGIYLLTTMQAPKQRAKPIQS